MEIEDALVEIQKLRDEMEQKDALISKMEAEAETARADLLARDERINKLQGIIADHVPMTKAPPAEGVAEKTFSEKYQEMIQNNKK